MHFSIDVGIVRWNDDVDGLIITTRLCDQAFHFYHAVIGIDHGVAAGRWSADVDEVPKNSVSKSDAHQRNRRNH
jgi:hypothetical protein